MDRRLSLATCCDRGRLTWICSPAYRGEKHSLSTFSPQKKSYLFKLDHDVPGQVFLEKFTPYVKRVVTTSNFHLQLSNDHSISFLLLCLRNLKGIAESCDLISDLCSMDINWSLIAQTPINTLI